MGEKMMEDSLQDYVDDFFEMLVLFDDYWNNHKYKGILKASIDLFLDKKNNYSAMKVYEMFFMIYQINSKDKSCGELSILNDANIPLDFVKLMNRYAHLSDSDVLIRSVDVFIMGLAIYSRNESYRSYFRAYVLRSPYEKYYRDGGELSHEEFLYRWAIASLFCDIALPFEFMTKFLKSRLNKEFNSILSGYGERFPVDFTSFRKLDSIAVMPHFKDRYVSRYPQTKFMDLSKPTQILVHKIGLDFSIDLKNQKLLIDFIDNHMYGDCPNSENEVIDHGLLSSIILLNFYAYMMDKYVKDPEFFYYPIVDSASAILLHNFYPLLMKKPFELENLDPEDSPLAWLLILCDNLYEEFSELRLGISDDSLDILYIVRDVAFHIHSHADDTQGYLESILYLGRVFENGLRVFTESRYDAEGILELVKHESFRQNMAIADIENLAMKIHNSHEKLFEMEEISYPTFHDLSARLKLNTIREAMSMFKKLNLVGCEIVDGSDERPSYELSEREFYDLAMLTHELWCEEKESVGWRYGPVKDDDKLTTPFLVRWNQLSREVQEYDYNSMKNIPKLLDDCGLKIALSRISMLADEFLNDGDRYFRYIQINRLAKILSERGFELVKKDNPREAVLFFARDDLEYLAQKNHEEWCNLKHKLGWTYGLFDENRMTDPDLIRWFNLDREVQHRCIDEIRRLPEACDAVGLKIVKAR